MMKNHDKSDEINHNPNWSYIPGHPYRIFFICGSRSEKTNVLLNLKRHQRPDIDKIYLCVKVHTNQRINCLLMEEKK